MNNGDAHLFKIARSCSLMSDYTSNCSSARIGCVISYKGSILAKGHNSNKTHTAQAKYNIWRYKDKSNNYLPEKVHAEISALEKVKYLDIDFSKVHIYIYRETRKGELAMARPCKACLARIKELGIKHISYTTDSGYASERLI